MAGKKKGKKSEDFSEKVVLVMLLAVIFVSLISLGVYLKAWDNSKTQLTMNNKQDKQQVLADETEIQNRNVPENATALARGKVMMKIIET